MKCNGGMAALDPRDPVNEGKSDLFPETSVTMMDAIRVGNEATAERAINSFADAYCEPLIRFVRGRGLSHEEAKDVVQEFFLEVIIQRDVLRKLDPANWRLRSFLRVAVTRYLASYHRKQSREKRGGHLKRTIFEEFKLPTNDADPAVMEFERDWAQSVLDRVYTRLRGKFRRPGRERFYDALEDCIPWRSGHAPLVDIAKSFGKKDDAVKAQLKRIWDAYREFLYAEVRETVLDPKEINEEIKHLVKVLESSPGERKTTV